MKPCLAIISIGEDKQSKIFIGLKIEACEKAGIETMVYEFGETAEEVFVLDRIKSLNNDSSVHGILVQLPIPEKFDTRKILDSVAVEKDVDGLSRLNDNYPCAVDAILSMIKEPAGKHVVIISRSILIGRPLAMALLDRNATVTICHSKTRNLAKHAYQADVVISGTGEQTVTKDMMRGDSQLIDVTERGTVGPKTVEMVIKNLMRCYESQTSIKK